MAMKIPPFREFIVVCNWCNSEICTHYPMVFDVLNNPYISPGTKVIRKDGKIFKEAILNKNGYIKYKNEIGGSNE